MILIHGEGNTDYPVGNDDDGLGGGKSTVAQMQIERASSGGADGGPGGIVEQTAILARTTLTQTPATAVLAGIVGSRIESKEGDHRITTVKWHTGEERCATNAGERAHAIDRLQPLNERCAFAGTRGDLGELALEPVSKAAHGAQQLASFAFEAGQYTQGLLEHALGVDQRGAPAGELAQQLLVGAQRREWMQTRAVFGHVSSNDLCVQPVGLATRPQMHARRSAR